MSCIARPRNTSRKMLYFYMISATSGKKLGFCMGTKKGKGGQQQKARFYRQKTPKYGAIDRKVGEMANNERAFLDENHAFCG